MNIETYTSTMRVNVKIFPLHIDFLRPFLEPITTFVNSPEEADFILAMNIWEGYGGAKLAEARRWGKPIAWWSFEDPMWYRHFLAQAARADFVFTPDSECIPRYCQDLGHQRVFWLPLACSPLHHVPRELVAEATDFVISANWYAFEARYWAIRMVVDPFCVAGWRLTLFCQQQHKWPPQYARWQRGETSYLSVSDQYAHGRVVLGINNQRSGFDGHGRTTGGSMRTYEALACGKPLLAAQSDLYEALGLVNGEHMVWLDQPDHTLAWGQRLLGEEGARMAAAGREFILAHHTYAHRLAKIAEIVMGR